jgi:L-ascorbate metabolism protein UlaG (beta-lactamase superfamily)
MVITYVGGECFKLTQGDLTIAINPPSKDSSLKTPKFGSDIVLITLNHDDFNGASQVSFGERAPFAITGPGEYEVKGVAVRGFASESNYGGEKGINTIYSILIEGMNLAFLGALGSPDLSKEAVEGLDDIDILFVPIGGNGTLDEQEAYKLAVQLEPKVMVPMHYSADQLKRFLKEAGEEVQPVEKLTVKRKDLEGKEDEIVVLATS